MNFISVILSAVFMMLLSDSARGRRVDCKSECCSFVEGFPARLKELRTSYKKIKDFYESNDDLTFALLDEDVHDSVNSVYGCHVMNDILHFYLDTVLPEAVENQRPILKSSINSIGNIFTELKRNMLKCRNYFSCQKPFEIGSIKKSYEEMEGKGLNKAMGDLDLLFGYIEEYLASKRTKH